MLPGKSRRNNFFSVGELQTDRQARKNFGKLLLGKVTKIVGTRCHILRLKWGD